MVVIGLAFAQEEVIVQAPERSLEAETSAQVTVVPIDDRLPESADLGSVVGSVPGVVLRRLGGLGDLSTVSIRGSTGRQVEVFLDGVSLNPDGVGTVDLSEYPLRSFERVEVYRGNAPVGMGGTAMGGAVNLVTGKDPTTVFSALLGTQRTARLQGLLRRDLPGGDVLVGMRGLSTSGRFRYFVQGAPTVVEDDSWSVRSNNDLRQANLITRWRWGNDHLRISAFELFNGREEGVPGFTAAPLRAVRLETAQSLTVLQLDALGAVPHRLRLHLQQRNETLRDPLDEIALGGNGANRMLSVGVQLLGGATEAPWWRLSWSATARWERVLDRGQRQVGRLEVGGWFRRGRLRVEPAVAVFGLRSDGAGEASGLQVLPRVGLSVQLAEGLLWKGNAGRTVRPPDLLELFGNRGPLVGRPDLRSERGLYLDLGLRAQGDWGVAELGAFANESVDLITYIQNAQGAAVPANLGRTGVHGLEVALQLRAWTWLDWQSNLTLQRSVNRSDDPIYSGKRLPRQPTLQLDQRTGIVFGRVRVGHGLSYTDGIYTDAVQQRRQAPRPLHTLFARVELGSGLQLSADLQNLLDTKTQRVALNALDPSGARGPAAISDYLGYPLPGRTLLLTLRYVAE